MKLSFSVVGNLFTYSQEVTEAKFELRPDCISQFYSSSTCCPLWDLTAQFRREIIHTNKITRYEQIQTRSGKREKD